MHERSALPEPVPEDGRSLAAIVAQAGCATCGAPGDAAEPAGTPAATSYIYAIGRIEPRFPSLSVEKEFAQAAGRSDTAGQTDRQMLQAVLSRRENRYLLRQMCWVFNIQGLDTYLMLPRDPLDIELLAAALRPVVSETDIDVAIGIRGPIASPAMCNGMMVPLLVFDQIYSFDQPALIQAIPRPERIDEERFGPAAAELFARIMHMTDNAGASNEHRALNYLAMRYPAIYARTAEQYALDFSLTGVETRPAPLSNTRRLVDVVFAYTNRGTDFTEKYFVRVDVTEEFPFLARKLSPYYDRGGAA